MSTSLTQALVSRYRETPALGGGNMISDSYCQHFCFRAALPILLSDRNPIWRSVIAPVYLSRARLHRASQALPPEDGDNGSSGTKNVRWSFLTECLSASCPHPDTERSRGYSSVLHEARRCIFTSEQKEQHRVTAEQRCFGEEDRVCCSASQPGHRAAFWLSNMI